MAQTFAPPYPYTPGETNGLTVRYPPALTSLVPNTVVLGSPDFTIHVHGVGFVPGASIVWNGTAEPTTRISDTELTTGVNMATATVPASVPVGVKNSAAGQSGPTLPFTFTAA